MQATAIEYHRLKIGAVVRVTVSKTLVSQYELVSRVWQGEIKDTSLWTKEHIQNGQAPKHKLAVLKALQLDARPMLMESDYCLRCGIYLETDTSKRFGYDLSCGGKFGIPNWSMFNEDVLDELRSSLAEPYRRREMWIQVDTSDVEVLEDAPVTDQPKVDWDVRFVVERNEIVVTTPEVERFKSVVRSVPGYRWDARFNVWRFKATPSIAIQLKEAFEGYQRRGTQEFITLIKKAEGQKAAQSLKVRTDLPPIPGMKGGGWGHQRQAFYFLYRILTGEDLTENVTDD